MSVEETVHSTVDPKFQLSPHHERSVCIRFMLGASIRTGLGFSFCRPEAVTIEIAKLSVLVAVS